MTDKIAALLRQALEALEDHAKQYPHMQKGYTVDAITALRTALAEQPAEQEPVRGEWQGYTWNPYAVSQPKAEPLTDEEIDNTTRKQVDDLLDHIYEYGTAAEGIDYRVRAIARAIERAHGIGESHDRPRIP